MGRHIHNKYLIAVNSAMLSGLFRGLGALPWGVLRGVSSMISWLALNVVRYRTDVARGNISSSFPEMDAAKVDAVLREYYRFLADYFVETVKLGAMKPDEMRRRMKFENIEEVNVDLREGRNVSVFLGHYCNWEWVSSMPLWLDLSRDTEPCQIYHPLSNVAADRVFGNIRRRFGATNLPMSTSAKTLMEKSARGVPTITGYIADQTPSWRAIHHWLPFLHHDTPVFTGAEKISRKIHASAYYLDMRMARRGEYVGKFVKISDDVAGEELNAVTERYFSLLEQSIRNQPAFWLWTHRRWKHKR